MLTTYRRVLGLPGALVFSLSGLVARLPISMVSLGIIVLVSERTGSYARAGTVSAAFLVANALVSVLQSRVLDRLGQSRVLPLTMSVFAAALALIGALSLGGGVLFTLNIKPIQRTLFPTAWDPTVRFLAEIPAEMNTSEVVIIVITSILLSLVATLYPSWRAARLDPVQALRYG